MPSKGQTSLEFIAMLSFIMLAFAGFFSMFVANQVQATEEQRAVYGKAVADRIAFEIDLALAEGDGFRRDVSLPESITGIPYTVNVSQGSVLVRWADRSAIAAIAAPRVVGNVTAGDNRFANRGGVVHVE